MKKRLSFVVLTLGLLLVNSSLWASLTIENDTPYAVYLVCNQKVVAFPSVLTQGTHTYAYTSFIYGLMVKEFGKTGCHLSIRVADISTGSARTLFELTNLDHSALDFQPTILNILGQTGFEAVYQGDEYIFSMKQTDRDAWMRLTRIPITSTRSHHP